jgi:AcrR family transcriptional regulator
MTLFETHIDARQRLLHAAGQVFAENGYEKSTVREICERAGTNVASVNYYFQDKGELYRAVFDLAHERMQEQMDGTGEGAESRPAEERLRLFIHGHVRGVLGIAGPPAWFSTLVTREMIEPTHMQREIFAREIKPRSDMVVGIVRELLGPKASDEQVRHCALSVVGQTVFHKLAQPIISILHPDQGYTEAEVNRLAEHIAGFSLAGIMAERQRLEDNS